MAFVIYENVFDAEDEVPSDVWAPVMDEDGKLQLFHNNEQVIAYRLAAKNKIIVEDYDPATAPLFELPMVLIEDDGR